LDVIYSGDWDLINQYYCIENADVFVEMVNERRDRYYTDKLKELQQTVNNNVTAKHSIYVHDIWTYVSFMMPVGSQMFSLWMQELIDAGEYERVNIVEFAYHFYASRGGDSIAAFRRFYEEDNMQIYTHYNLDVIFSGDQALIDSYYAKENEAQHTAIVQAAW